MKDMTDAEIIEQWNALTAALDIGYTLDQQIKALVRMGGGVIAAQGYTISLEPCPNRWGGRRRRRV